MRLPSSVWLIAAASLVLAGCQRDQSANDEDDSVEDDDTAGFCLPDCECDKNGLLPCADPAPRIATEYPVDLIQGLRVDYEISHPGANDDYLQFTIMIGSCQLLLSTGALLPVNSNLEETPVSYHVSYYATSTRQGETKEECLPRRHVPAEDKYSLFDGCGTLTIEELEYDRATATAKFIKGSFNNAHLCHVGSLPKAPSLDEQGLPQEFNLIEFEFETDQLEASLDFHD